MGQIFFYRGAFRRRFKLFEKLLELSTAVRVFVVVVVVVYVCVCFFLTREKNCVLRKGFQIHLYKFSDREFGQKLEQLCTDVHEIFQSTSLHFLIIANAFSGEGGSAE